MPESKISPIFITTFYLIIGSILCPILFLVKLLIVGVSIDKWGGEFLWLLEMLCLSWIAALSMAWIFGKLRYSSINRVAGALLFGLLSPIIILLSIMAFGYIFGSIVSLGLDTKEGQRNIMYLYVFFFMSISALYISVYDKT